MIDSRDYEGFIRFLAAAAILGALVLGVAAFCAGSYFSRATGEKPAKEAPR